MPSSTRGGTNRPISPGRGNPHRKRRRPASSSPAKAAAPAEETDAASSDTLGKGFHITRRAVALFVLIVVLGVSYFNSLRLYFDQEQQLEATRTEIAQRTEAISDLESELDRWQDPAYVKAQARTRLGWVMPGESGFRVVDSDGNLVGSGTQISQQGSVPPGEEPPTWYESMWDSVGSAGNPK